MSWLREENLLEERQRQKRGPVEGWLGVVSTVSGEDEQVGWESTNSGTSSVLHPYVGVRSWIRAMPEPGTPVVLTRRGDSNRSDIARYVNANAGARVAAYRQQRSFYRPLTPGAIEIHAGWSTTRWPSWDEAPRWFHQVGPIVRWDDAVLVESGARAATHVRQLHHHHPAEVKNLERFGVVRRPSSQAPAAFWQAKDREVEYLRQISTVQDGQPVVDIRDGTLVVEDDGREAKWQGKRLRMRVRRWSEDGQVTWEDGWTSDGQLYTQIDGQTRQTIQADRMSWIGQLADVQLTAVKGDVKVQTQAGKIQVSSASQMSWSAVQDIQVKAGTQWTCQAGTSASLIAPAVALGSQAASHPLVYGDQLIALLTQLIAILVGHQHIVTVPTQPTLPDPSTTVGPLQALLPQIVPGVLTSLTVKTS